jgi:peptidoglycan/LPS O-acetylase OafA/YrhL
LTAPSIILTFGNVPTRLASWISEKLGDIFYGVYLYQFPIQVMVWIALLPRMGCSGWRSGSPPLPAAAQERASPRARARTLGRSC